MLLDPVDGVSVVVTGLVELIDELKATLFANNSLVRFFAVMCLRSIS